MFAILMMWGAGSRGGISTPTLSNDKVVTLEVQYSSKWGGAIINGASNSVSWFGDGNYVKTLTRPSSGSWIVSVNAQKQDSNNINMLMLCIKIDGKVVEQQSTTSAYGFVQISATIP